MILGACAGGADDTADAPTTTSASTTSTNPPTTTTQAPSTTTTTTTSTTSTTTTTTVPVFTARTNPLIGVCADWAAAAAVTVEALTEPTDVEAYWREQQSLADRITLLVGGEVAPDAIRHAINVEAVVEAYVETGWDVAATASTLEALRASPTREFASARATVQGWIDATCVDAADLPLLAGVEVLRSDDLYAAILGDSDAAERFIDTVTAEGILTSDQAECAISLTDPADLARFADGRTPTAADEGTLLFVLLSCGID